MEQLKDESNRLRAVLTTKICEIMRDSSTVKVLKQGVVESHLLHKARLRIWSQLRSCLAADHKALDCSISVSEYEIERAALTVAHAMVNPHYVEWDADRYCEVVKLSPPNKDGLPSAEPERLRKFFPKAELGRISAPATVVDKHGKILTIYLPDILSPTRVIHTNAATKRLQGMLLRSFPTPGSAQKVPWRSKGFCAPEGGGEFGAGRVTISPAYFMQRHERLQDPLVTSASYSSPEVQGWLAALSTTELFWNAITAAVAPDLFQAGSAAVSRVLQEICSSHPKKSTAASQWPSIFSGLEIIVNRVTLSHRDAGGSPTLYDLLVSLGNSHTATLRLADVGAELDYFPGTMLFISGKVLEHAVGPWTNGERYVIAHFMKDKVHDRMGVPRPPFPMQTFFLEMVGKEVGRGKHKSK